MGARISLRVECYAGHRADQRPLRFELRGRVFEVELVEDQWYSPDEIYFRVRADDGNFYVLRHDEAQDTWSLDAFRASRDNAEAATSNTVAPSSPRAVS